MKKGLSKAIFASALTLVFTAMPILAGCNPKPAPVDLGATVTLKYEDGLSRDRLLFADADGKVSYNAEPTTRGYKFDYWSTVKGDASTKVDINSLKVTESMTLYANWKTMAYTVTFDYGIDGVANYTVDKDYNVPLEAKDKPTDPPEKSGYWLYGWSTVKEDQAPSTFVTFPTEGVTADITYYAWWAADGLSAYTVTFDINYTPEEGDTPAEVAAMSDLLEGQTYTLPRNISRKGFKFVGWGKNASASKDSALPAAYIPNDTDGNIKLYAIWEELPARSIKFDLNFTGGGVYSIVSMKDGYTFTQADIDAGVASGKKLEREGFEFNGWWTLPAGGRQLDIDAGVEVSGDTTYYAHWQTPLVYTNIFDAEFVYIDPNATGLGYSGATADGYGTINEDNGAEKGATTQHKAGSLFAGSVYFRGWLYVPGYTLVFNINSDKAVKGAELVVRLAIEEDVGSSYAFTPDGETNGFDISVNGNSIKYGSITVNNKFKDYVIGNIDLVEGKNTIVLKINNEHSLGGTTQAAAPIIDCIKINKCGDAKLGWNPEYDNLSNT